MSSPLLWFMIGLAYAYCGVFLTAYGDPKHDDVVVRWCGASTLRVLLVLAGWPLALPLLWGTVAIRQDVDEHGQL